MTIVLPQHEREPQSIESHCLMLYHAEATEKVWVSKAVYEVNCVVFVLRTARISLTVENIL